MLSNTVSLCQWKCGKSLRLISHSNCFSADAYRSISTHTSPVSSSSLSQETIQPKKPPRTELRTAIVLSRTPILNRAPTSFERAYYAYQTGIARALHNPIPYDFYFKPGSPLEARFNVEERRREVKSFGQRFGEMSMGDLGAGVAPDQLGLQEGEGELIMPRVHEADRVLDFKSLNRRGQQNLYLLLNRKEGQTAVWRLPQGDVEQGEFLHQAAQRNLHTECGSYMDTWIVSRNPIGVYKPPISTEPGVSITEALFFFKAYILAGQIQPNAEILDFGWFTKKEIRTKVKNKYWHGVKDMLSDF